MIGYESLYRLNLRATPRVGKIAFNTVVAEEEWVNYQIGLIVDLLKPRIKKQLNGELKPGFGLVYYTTDVNEARELHQLCYATIGPDLFSSGAAYLELVKIEQIDGDIDLRM